MGLAIFEVKGTDVCPEPNAQEIARQLSIAARAEKLLTAAVDILEMGDLRHSSCAGTAERMEALRAAVSDTQEVI